MKREDVRIRLDRYTICSPMQSPVFVHGRYLYFDGFNWCREILHVIALDVCCWHYWNARYTGSCEI